MNIYEVTFEHPHVEDERYKGFVVAEDLADVQERCEGLISNSNKTVLVRQVLLVGPVAAMHTASALYINKADHCLMGKE